MQGYGGRRMNDVLTRLAWTEIAILSVHLFTTQPSLVSVRSGWTHTNEQEPQSSALFSRFVEINLHICRRATVCHFNPCPTTHYLVPFPQSCRGQRRDKPLLGSTVPASLCLLIAKNERDKNRRAVQCWPWPALFSDTTSIPDPSS